MLEYKVYKSRWKAVRLIFLCSIFILIGIFLLNQPGTSKFGAWSCILFFGLGFPVGFFQLLDRRPQIIINEIGIFDRTTHKDFINWEIIEDAYLLEMQRQKFICLVLDAQFEPSKKKGNVASRLAKLSKTLGFQELNISLANVNVNPLRLTEFILAMRKADGPQRGFLLNEALAKAVYV